MCLIKIFPCFFLIAGFFIKPGHFIINSGFIPGGGVFFICGSGIAFQGIFCITGNGITITQIFIRLEFFRIIFHSFFEIGNGFFFIPFFQLLLCQIHVAFRICLFHFLCGLILNFRFFRLLFDIINISGFIIRLRFH